MGGSGEKLFARRIAGSWGIPPTKQPLSRGKVGEKTAGGAGNLKGVGEGKKDGGWEDKRPPAEVSFKREKKTCSRLIFSRFKDKFAAGHRISKDKS